MAASSNQDKVTEHKKLSCLLDLSASNFTDEDLPTLTGNDLTDALSEQGPGHLCELLPHQPAADLSEYTIECPIGSGGYADVFLAVHRISGQSVAIKRLRQTAPRLVASFAQEVSILSSVNHPCLPNFIAWGNLSLEDKAPPTPALVTEYFDGINMGLLIHQGVKLSQFAALQIARQLALVLGYLHEMGIVHSDVKPGNILLTDDWHGNIHIKLLDLGIARLTEDCILKTDGPHCASATSGSISYMSPEQHRGLRLSHKADMYSWALTTLELLTGSLPVSGKSPQEALHMKENNAQAWIEPLLGSAFVPSYLKVLFRSCLKSNPEERPESMASVLQHLLEADEDEPIKCA